MVARVVSTHGERTCTVEVAPNEVDAGAELTVTVRASCPHGCHLAGQGVSIRDRDDTELAHASLSVDEGETCTAAALVLRAPYDVGEHVWRAVLATHESNGVRHDEVATPFSFTAMPHATSVNVWGLPSAISAGERFSFKVGIRCSAACKLAGRALSITDQDGAQILTAKLCDDVWPGTSALYFAEVEAQAPRTTGDFTWQVTTPASDQSLPHAAGSFGFPVKVVAQPDHEVTVEAFDGDTQAPIKGAHVLLHPYRAFTDERGVAKVKVAKGRYTLFVSGFNYIGYERIIDVTSDVTARVELAVEPEEEVDIR
jgi:hypothetical protein